MPDRLIRDELLRSGRWLDLGGDDARLGNAARLAFIACTLTADDLGNLEASPGDLVRLWRDVAGVRSRDEAEAVAKVLAAADLIRLYQADGKRYAHIPRYRQRLRHFKHAHPRPPDDVECNEIKELIAETPDARQTNVRRTTARARTEVKRSEEKGSEELQRQKRTSRLPPTGPDQPSPKARPTTPPATAKPSHPAKQPEEGQQEGVQEGRKPGASASGEGSGYLPPSSRVWNAYAAAYAVRYGAPPVRNATVNAQVVQLVKRLGVDDAEAVAGFYPTMNDSYYQQRGHAVGALLADAEKVRTQWATGRRNAGGHRDASTRRSQTIADLTGGPPAIDG